MQYLGFAFLAMLVLEILSIILVASWLGGLATFGLIVLSFFLGLFLMRRNAGFSKVLMAGEWMRNQGSISFYQLMWPIRIPIAGFLLMLPGFLSSLGAIALLIPFKGKPLMQTQSQKFYGTHTASADSEIIEGDFVVRNPTTNHSPTRKQLDVIEHQKD